MLSRLSLNLVLVAAVLASYLAVAMPLDGQRYCLGGSAVARSLPADSLPLVCSTLDLHLPQMPTLHWGALLP